MARVLIAEDDLSIQFLLKEHLKHTFSIMTANNGMEALEVIENGQVDLLITDIMMPVMDGIQLVNEIRKFNEKLPVIMLTAKSSITDKKEGFSVGADDYLTKPVDLEELTLRIGAMMRRANIATDRTLTIGNTVLDQLSYTVTYSEQIIDLPKKEFELLFKLLSYPNQIFTQAQLLDDIWGLDSYSSEDTVKTHISRLRKACQHIPDFTIKTVRGLGYKGEITID